MNPFQAHLSPQIAALLERLGKMFVWRRKALVEQVQTHLAQAESAHGALRARHRKLQGKAASLRRRARHEAERANGLGVALAQAESAHGSLSSRHSKLQDEAASLGLHLRRESDRATHLGAALEQAESAYGALSRRHRKLQGMAATRRKHVHREAKRADGIASTLAKVLERYGLVSRLLAAKPALNSGITCYRKALEEDYLAFAGQASSLVDSAKAYQTLKAIEVQLELIANAPGIHTRKVIAIAGGFSSGKSAFINSFIEAPEIELAVGMRPVTAIPTYVWSAPDSAIRAHTTTGGAIELDAALFRNISHEFLKSLGFDLKEIMPFISIATPMTQSQFDHLGLLDTPGYNPPQTAGYTGADMQAASSFSAQADAAVWLVGLDSTGTLVASDLDFIRNLDFGGDKFYVVANKADLRAPSDIDEILGNIAELLNDEGIPFSGISAYSADLKCEYAFHGESLHAFFARHNQPVDARAMLFGTIDQVFGGYREAIARDIGAALQAQRTFKSMELDLQQYASDQLISLLGERFASLKHAEREARLREHLKSARHIKAEMKAAVHETLLAVGMQFEDDAAGGEAFEDPQFENIDAILAVLREQADAALKHCNARAAHAEANPAGADAAKAKAAEKPAEAAPNPQAGKWMTFFRQFLGAPQADEQPGERS